MSESIRIAILGLSHDHIWDNLPFIVEHPDASLIAAFSQHEELLGRAKSEYGIAIYGDFEDLFNNESFDAVYVYGSNLEGAQWAIQAASNGKHVLVEKPMAASAAQADEMIATARMNNVRLMVNWPFAWWPQLQKALQMAKAGEIGDLWQVKYRAAHAGPQELGCSPYFCDWLFNPELNGGGAMMDYCCYGAVLASVLLGLPSRVSGFAGRLRKENIVVEDNAMITMTYPRAMATAEGSWTQIGKLTAYTTAIYGSQGTLMVEPRDGGRLLLATEEDPEGSAVELGDACSTKVNSAAHFIHCLQSGEAFQMLCQDRICRDAQEILEAGRLSSENGADVSLPL